MTKEVEILGREVRRRTSCGKWKKMWGKEPFVNIFVKFDNKRNMYYPESSLEMGISAPKAHQRIIGKLMTRLGHLFYQLHQISLEPLPETQIDEGQSSPVPDKR